MGVMRGWIFEGLADDSGVDFEGLADDSGADF